MIDLYLQMGIALILVSGLIVAIGLISKKRQEKVSLMNIMSYQSLGPKKGLAMVRVGQEVILVGVTATDIKYLKNVEQASSEPVRGQSWESTLAAETMAAEAAPEAAPAVKMSVAPAAARTASRVIVADAGQEASRPVMQSAVTAGKAMVADLSANLNKLRALKDSLVCR